MERLTQEQALRAYARMWNTMSVDPLEPLLAEDFVYESQIVFLPLEGKQAFLAYITGKIETIRREGATPFAEMGTITAYGGPQPCVVLAQFIKSNLVGIVLAETSGDRLKRLDYCIVPAPETARRSGEYPGA